ncbi:Transcription factor GLABRA 3 [Linum perenne]
MNSLDLLQESEACNRVKFAAPGDDLHYQSALSSIFKTSHPLMLGPHSRDHRQESSFISWKKVGLMKQTQKAVKCGTQQNMLKKVLFDIPQNHIYFYSRTPENGTIDGVLRSEADECGMNHILSEMKQRELLDQRFMVLKSIVPSVNKVDEVSILDETIEYLQELERRVDQLQSRLEKTDSEARTDRKHLRDPERTSDNYRSINQNGYARTTVGNKIQNYPKSMKRDQRSSPMHLFSKT